MSCSRQVFLQGSAVRPGRPVAGRLCLWLWMYQRCHRTVPVLQQVSLFTCLNTCLVDFHITYVWLWMYQRCHRTVPVLRQVSLLSSLILNISLHDYHYNLPMAGNVPTLPSDSTSATTSQSTPFICLNASPHDFHYNLRMTEYTNAAIGQY